MGTRRPRAGALLVLALAVACRPGATGAPDPTVAPPAPPAATAAEPVSRTLPPVPVDRCADVAPVAPAPSGAPATAGGGVGTLPDPVFLAVVNSYVGEHADVFGGRWLAGDGTYVVAVTDDAEAHRAMLAARAPTPAVFSGYWPPPQITDARPIGEWPVAWDVVLVEHAELDLVRAIAGVREAIDAAGVVTVRAHVDGPRNRLAIVLAEPIGAAAQARLAGVVDVGMVCIETPGAATAG